MVTRSAGYEFFDHTADIGIRARGATLAELLVQLARGLTELIAEDSRLQAQDTHDIRLTAADPEALALAWLQELLYWFSTDRFLPVEFKLEEVTETSVRGFVRGERFDPSRHVQGREVKAITRHLLSVRHENGAWRGEVVVDI
jgi:SHS2 domain-containing protein